MKRFATLIATTTLAAMMLVAAPGVASAEEVPSCEYTYNDVRDLELRVVEVEHENWMLRATLEEERDEHADDVDQLSREVWQVRDQLAEELDERGDQVRALEDTITEERDERHDAEAELSTANVIVARRDAQIQRLRQKVAQLRAQHRQ